MAENKWQTEDFDIDSDYKGLVKYMTISILQAHIVICGGCDNSSGYPTSLTYSAPTENYTVFKANTSMN